jgi:hypothetical protein
MATAIPSGRHPEPSRLAVWAADSKTAEGRPPETEPLEALTIRIARGGLVRRAVHALDELRHQPVFVGQDLGVHVRITWNQIGSR